MKIEIKPTSFLCPHCQKEIELRDVLVVAPSNELSLALRLRRKTPSILSPSEAQEMGKKSGRVRRQRRPTEIDSIHIEEKSVPMPEHESNP